MLGDTIGWALFTALVLFVAYRVFLSLRRTAHRRAGWKQAEAIAARRGWSHEPGRDIVRDMRYRLRGASPQGMAWTVEYLYLNAEDGPGGRFVWRTGLDATYERANLALVDPEDVRLVHEGKSIGG